MVENEESKPDQRKLKWLFRSGVAVSACYFIFIASYTAWNKGRFATLSPNELGDFLAGAFAPLAFLWLVLGFVQQGLELRNSAKALWLQGEELRNSVEQQRELVTVSREQLKFESEMIKAQKDENVRNSQPMLNLQEGGNTTDGPGKRLHTFRLTNHGKPCTGLSINSGTQASNWTADALETGRTFEFHISFPDGQVEEIVVTVSYFDVMLIRRTLKIRYVQEHRRISDRAACRLANPGQKNPAEAGLFFIAMPLSSKLPRQLRHRVEQVRDQAQVGDLEDRGVFVLVDGDDGF